MGKTIDQWQADIIAAKDADAVIGTGGSSELSSTSAVSIWRLWTRVVANAIYDLAGLFDFHKAEVKVIIAAEKAHKPNWYVGKAKAYQHGDSLPVDSDVYDPVKDASDPARVVTFAVMKETSSQLRMMVATGSAGSLSALGGSELTGLGTYMNRVKDAGVRVVCTTSNGDTLQPKIIIHYDPLVLDSSGARLDGTSTTPVMDAVKDFLAGLSELANATQSAITGRFVLEKFLDYLEAVEGVVIAEPVTMQAFYGAVSPIVFTNWYDPDGGYLVLDETYFGANVTYSAYVG